MSTKTGRVVWNITSSLPVEKTGLPLQLASLNSFTVNVYVQITSRNRDEQDKGLPPIEFKFFKMTFAVEILV
jgi:hypothetical protein